MPTVLRNPPRCARDPVPVVAGVWRLTMVAHPSWWLATALALAAGMGPARATVLAELAPAPPAPLRVNPQSTTVPPLRSGPGEAPAIEGRPANDAPSIDAAPLGTAPLRTADSDPQRQAVLQELHRLERTAESARPVGSTVPSAQAAWLLGLIYLHGAGVRHDPAQALQWFEQAARFGREPWAYAGLAWCHIEGCVGPANPAAAQRAIAQLRTRHPARADYLAWLLADRQVQAQVARPGAAAPDAQQDARTAAQAALLRKAAAAGDLHARLELGLQAAAQDRPDQADTFFRQIEARSPAAAANRRQLQERGRTPGHDSADAQAAGDASAAAALAQAHRYHRGEGVPANFVEAIRFYRLAEQRGSAEAHRMLALIYSRPAPGGGVDVAWMQQLARADASSSIPTFGSPVAAHALQREPTPLVDLLPPFWRRQLGALGE